MGEAVVERQDDERAEIRRDVDARERLLDVGRVVAVCQYDPLRIGRRAGRIGDRRVVVVADRLSDGEEFRAVFRQVVAAQPLERAVGRLARFEGDVAQHDDVFEFGQFGADAADLRQLVLRHEDRPHLGVAQAEEQVVRLLELDRQRHADRAGVEEAQLGDDPCVAPLRQDGDLVLGADADRGETRTGLEGQFARLGVGRGLELVVALLEQEGFGPVLLDGALEQVDDGFLHVSPFLIPQGMPTGAPRRCRSGACASCPSSASRAVCAYVRCRRRSTWPSRPCARPSPSRGR